MTLEMQKWLVAYGFKYQGHACADLKIFDFRIKVDGSDIVWGTSENRMHRTVSTETELKAAVRRAMVDIMTNIQAQLKALAKKWGM